LCFGPEAVDNSAEGVFEKFEADMGEMPWDIGEDEVGRADELDRGAFKHGIVLFADEAGVFDSFLYNVVDVLQVRLAIGRALRGKVTHSFSANDAYIIFVWLLCV
jgi:hypothetical protein